MEKIRGSPEITSLSKVECILVTVVHLWEPFNVYNSVPSRWRLIKTFANMLEFSPADATAGKSLDHHINFIVWRK